MIAATAVGVLGHDAEPQREQAVDGRLRRRRLAERRQDLRDVAQEHRVRPDDEHAFAREPGAVLVQQERGAVQADRGLARARTALHDQARLDRRADDRVLFGLDRRDDVAHLPGAGPAELGEQRIGHPARARERVGIGEVLLEDVGELAAREHEPAPPLEPERVGERRPVERRRDAGPPVDDHRSAVAVFDVAPADVPALARFLVDPAEAQDRDVVVERREPALQLPAHRLGIGLVRGEDVFVGDLGRRPPAHGLEARLGELQARAFERDVRVRHWVQDTERPARPGRFSDDLAHLVHHPYIAPS